MHRLLAADDFAFLGRQPGFHSQVAAKLRARRVSIFKTYLNSLETEFSRLHRALRLLTLVAGHDRPEIAQLLLEQRVQFTFRLWDARIRLALFGFGVRPADLSGVADAIQQLRERVQILQAPLQSAPMTA